MSWPSFLAPWWGLLALAAIPLILLYVLRQKRPDWPISSTLLWSKTLADLRASTPWQRLRRNLLLLLQLLILACLVFTLMRPVMQSEATTSVAGVIVIDASANMQAKDGGEPGHEMTRLDRAKVEAHRLVDNMKRGDRFMLLADGGGMVQVRSAFTANKSELHQLIDQVRPSDTTTDLSETLLLGVTSLQAIGGENRGENKSEALTAGKIWLFSDGVGVRLPNVSGIDRMLSHVRIGQSKNNVGIVRLAITPVPKTPKTYQIFVGLTNSSDQERSVPVGLAYGAADKINDVKRVTLPAAKDGVNGQGSVLFQSTLEPGRIYVRLDGKDDDFPLDDTAYGLVEPARKVRVTLVSKQNVLLERFLQTAATAGELEGMLIDPSRYKSDLKSDLVILDGYTPSEMPKCDTLAFRPNSGAGVKVVGEIKNPSVLRWKRDDPLMAYVELGDLRISHALMLEHDAEATELVASVNGPLILAKDAGSARRYLVTFDPMTESNWWMQPSLLIFLQNVVSQTRSRHYIGMPQMLATGQSAQLWDLGKTATVLTPGGGAMEMETREGAAEFAATDKVGFYDVSSGDKKAAFAVNLLSPSASSIAPQRLESGLGGNITEATSVARVNREVWPWLAGAALAVLLLEWWVYHRRLA